MIRLLVLLLLFPHLAFSQLPTEIFEKIQNEFFDKFDDGKWETKGFDIEKFEVERFKDFDYTWNYPFNNDDAFTIETIIWPGLQTYRSSSNKNIYYSYLSDLASNNTIESYLKYNINEKSYEKLFEDIFYAEDKRQYNKWGPEGEYLSINSSTVYRFCETNDCNLFIETKATSKNGFDLDNYSQPYVLDLDIINEKLNNLNSSSDIKFKVIDYEKIYPRDSSLTNGGSREYKLIFLEKGAQLIDEIIPKNLNFSINDDFELLFPIDRHGDISGLNPDWDINISLGFSKITKANSDRIDPLPVTGSRNYQLKFKIKQVLSDVRKGFLDKTIFSLEKFYKGIKVEDKKFVLETNYLGKYYAHNNGTQIKINRVENVIYFSINQDLLYGTKVDKFESNKFVVDHKAYSYNDFYKAENHSRIYDLVFSNSSKIENKKIESKKESNWAGSGTGFFISTDGYIATNYHVIKDAKEIEINLNKDKTLKYKAKIIQIDENSDLAILKVDDNSFTELPNILYNIKDRGSDVGTEVFALGYPLALSGMGNEIKFTNGMISSKTGFNNDVRLYQTTTPLQKGNSGGPLFDYNGNLIGINSSKISDDLADNVSYSIKASYLSNFIDVLDENIPFPENKELSGKPLTEIIKKLSEYVVLIKVR